MWRRRLSLGRAAAVLLLATVVLLAAGCSARPAASRGSVAACTQFGLSAVRRHVTVTSIPLACQGLTRAQFASAVSGAVHSAAVGAHGKVGQRESLGAASRYLAFLIAAVAAPRTGRPSPAPSNPQASKAALGYAALGAWLVTIGLGLRLLLLWLRPRRRRAGPRRSRRPASLNFAHLGLALASLLVWAAYLGTGVTGLAYAACALLAVVTGLGMALVFLAAARPARPAASPAPQPAEPAQPAAAAPRRRLVPPAFVVGAHIVFAMLTILLAVLAAIGPG